jgi:LuxR family quorum sensing-dependent transcriptional regulator
VTSKVQRTDLQRALTFIERAEEAVSLEALQETLSETLDQFGVASFTLMALAKHPGNGARSPLPLSRATPAEWVRRYTERGYFNSDIVTHKAIRQSLPFTWEHVDLKALSPSAKTVFEEGRDILKARASLVIPTHDAQGFAGYISLFFPEVSPDDERRRALKLIAIYALEKAKELRGVEPDHAGWDAPCPLTPRQREALAFLAIGKTDWEIGAILGIAEKTANHHFEAAKRLLGVATRAQAVARAIHNGWIAI